MNVYHQMSHPSCANMTRGQENRRKSGRHLAAVVDKDPGMGSVDIFVDMFGKSVRNIADGMHRTCGALGRF